MTSSLASLARAAARAVSYVTLALAAAGLAGCGGGGTQFASGGIVGTGDARVLSSGIITATAPGAIVVNGQTVSIAGATVSINGVAASAADLRIGMVVAVDGRVNPDGSAVATSVAYRAEVAGVVDGVDVAASAFTLLGQRVRTDRLTVFEGGTLASMLGQRVEVSGLRAGPADVFATWIQVSAEPPPAVVPIEVVGTVAALDATVKRFSVGSQLVDYASLAATAVPAGFANGSKVRVSGTVPVAGGIVTATAIALVAPPLPGQNAQRVELDGFVTDFAGLASFRVNDQPVDARSATFENGSAASLGNGARVEVEGRLDNGVVIASKVEFEHAATVDLDGNVQSVNVPGATFVVGGETIAVVASTQFEDRTASPDPSFALAKLAVGDRVAVKARAGPTGWIALRVERLALDAPPPGNATVKVEGVISAFASVADFTVAGQRVNASGASFENGRAADLAVGVRVEIEGSLSGGVLVAAKVDVSVPDPSEGAQSVKVSGPIGAFVSKASFLVAGQPVDASFATFENGTASDLANGRTVEATGTVSGGVLRATRVTFASLGGGTQLQVEGPIETFASPASFRVSGQLINATGAKYKNGTVADLAVGREVEVKGALTGGVLMATHVEFKDAPEAEEIEVKGTVSSFVSVSNFVVAGRKVDASSAEFDDGDASGLANGTSVEVKGMLVGTTLKATKVKFR
ncbi:MAG TPA: DUF5666 domain-containing protein [Casimicrobiaceae bacterium]|nr:DUF5666 domain-containing protein [Casimicrobiaceae bacterium]